MASTPHEIAEEAERAIAALKRLSSAPWQAWRLQDDAELPTHNELAAWVVVGAVQQGQQQGQHHQLLPQLLAALSHGMAELGKLRLLPSNLQQHKEQLALLRRLWEDLATGWGTCNEADCRVSEAQRQRALIRLSVMATKAGLFTASSSCSTLAAVINAHAAASGAQQQDQQQRQPPDELEGSGVAALAATMLLSATQISDCWPGGGGILSLALAPAVPALVELAVAVIRSPAAACSCKPQLPLQRWDVEVSNPLQAAVVFTWCLAILHTSCSAQKEPQLEQLASSAAAGELLLLVLGLTAQLQHEQQQGLSPAPAAQPQQQEAQGGAQQQQRQRLVVPPYHQQLLKVLGLPGRVSGVAQAAWGQCPTYVVNNLLWHVLSATLLRPDLALLPIRRDSNSSSSTSSSSQASSSSQQAQQPGQQAATGTGVSAFVPVLLVLVEVIALQPVAHRFVHAAHSLAALVGPPLDCRLELQLAKHLLPAVLRQLLPAAKHAAAQRSPPGAAAAASEQGRLQLLEVDLPVIVGVLTFHAVKTFKGIAAAVAAFAQHTEEYSALLQAALRHSMQHNNHRGVSVEIASVSRLLQSTADSTVLEAVSAGRQLPLLLVSLLKALASQAAGSAISSKANSCSDAVGIIQDLLACAQMVMSKLAGCLSAARQAASTDTSSSSSDHSQHQLLAMLLARCLVVVGLLLRAQMEQETALLAAPLHWKAVAACQKALEAGDTIVDVLVEELQSLAAAHPAQLPCAALQQLADEHVQPFKAAWQGDFQGGLAAVAAASLEAAAAAREWLQSPAAATPAQQLEAFGAAVAGLLPLPDCCNYHRCSSASRVSEGELVSGNSCVCGGCGVARYCSRDCQVAHYKGWHKAVCKRLQQQQQQQQQ